MKDLKFSPAAYADIDKIWDYTAQQWSVDQAENYTDQLQDACIAIAEGSKIGRPTGIRTKTFKIRSGAHMIYYRITPERIDIIRILHGKQDVERHLQT